MKRMWSKNELKNLANTQVQEQVSGGQLENVKVFEEIVDKDGHKRFIEGGLDYRTATGLTFVYGRWSLSGTHLMIVCSGNVANATELSAGVLCVTKNLPKWVHDKIVKVFATNSIETKQMSLNADNYSTQNVGVTLQKVTNEIQVYMNSVTLTADRAFRLVFDILIDNE